jgi:hypothetical protein
MTILILGGADDEHAVHVHRELLTHGRDAEFLDTRHFPARMQIAYDPAAGAGHFVLETGRKIPFEEITAIYWRCFHGVGAAELPNAEQAYIARNDARSLCESLLIDLPTRWVNGWSAFQLHQTKAVAFRRVAQLGVRVPETLLANDAAAVRAFAAVHPRLIFKPVQGGAHTRRVTPDHLSDANLLSLSAAPVTLQEEIDGTNIRVFVAGERVLACEVRTDAIDFRDDAAPEIIAIDVSHELAAQSRAIAHALDLIWTGIDYRRTPGGDHFFLEANPSPMFLGFERRCGLPLTESLLALLH